MKILVPVKRVIDAYVKVRVNSDNTGVVTENVKMALNPFDEIALEAAVRLKEAGIASEILAVTVGPEAAQQQLRNALAIGADRAVQIEAPADVQPLAVARALSALCDRETPDLVLMGKQAIDDDANQVGQMLSALKGWAQGTFISAIEITDGMAIVTREVDAGLERLQLPLPAVVTADLRLNEPRYPKLPDIMKAKKKPIETLTAEALGVDLNTGLSVIRMAEPPVRSGGVRVANVTELVDKLRNEARVI